MNLDLALGLINPKYPHNVGTAIRAASCYAAQHLFYSGNRMDENLQELSRVPREERLRGYMEVEWKRDDYFIRHCVKQGLTPVAVEFRDQAENLFDFIHPEKALYVFGPEDGRIDKAALASCHRFVCIPTNYCLNLAVAITTILYDRKFKEYHKMFFEPQWRDLSSDEKPQLGDRFEVSDGVWAHFEKGDIKTLFKNKRWQRKI